MHETTAKHIAIQYLCVSISHGGLHLAKLWIWKLREIESMCSSSNEARSPIIPIFANIWLLKHYATEVFDGHQEIEIESLKPLTRKNSMKMNAQSRRSTWMFVVRIFWRIYIVFHGGQSWLATSSDADVRRWRGDRMAKWNSWQIWFCLMSALGIADRS